MNQVSRIRFQHIRTEAEGYFELGMYQHALDLLTKIESKVLKGDLGVLFLRGECLRALNRLHEACEVLEEVAATRPGKTFIFVSLAWCQKRIGRIDLACETLLEALFFEGDNPLLHFNVSCYYSLLGQKENAIEHLNRALVLDPSFREKISKESDFDPVRNEPEFLSLFTANA